MKDEYIGNVVITEDVTYNGEAYSVTSIGKEAFSGCSAITGVENPNSVTSIGYATFKDCSNLKTIYISDPITSIGDYAFDNCKNISDIKIGSKRLIAVSENIFSSDIYSSACLYIPVGCKQLYVKRKPWSYFVIQ